MKSRIPDVDNDSGKFYINVYALREHANPRLHVSQGERKRGRISRADQPIDRSRDLGCPFSSLFIPGPRRQIGYGEWIVFPDDKITRAKSPAIRESYLPA